MLQFTCLVLSEYSYYSNVRRWVLICFFPLLENCFEGTFSKNCCHHHNFPKVPPCMATHDMKHHGHDSACLRKKNTNNANLWKNYGVSQVHFCHLQLFPLQILSVKELKAILPSQWEKYFLWTDLRCRMEPSSRKQPPLHPHFIPIPLKVHTTQR